MSDDIVIKVTGKVRSGMSCYAIELSNYNILGDKNGE